MRCLLGFMCVLALGVMGCSETAGTGGSAGDGACETLFDCDDGNACTWDGCVEGTCSNRDADDGARCDFGGLSGVCMSAVCQHGGVFHCTEQGIRAAIAEGGGPFTFDCDGPTTVVTEGHISIDKDVILDGEGNLTVDGDYVVQQQSPPGGHVELRGFGIEGEIATGGSVVTLVDSQVGRSGRIATLGQGSSLVLLNSTVLGAISNEDGGVLTMINSTLSGGSILHAGTAATIINSTLSGDNCLIDATTRSYTIANSLIEGRCCADVTSDGYNIESAGDTCGFDQPTDQINVSAEALALEPLQDNGGPTETHALGAGSVAIDVVPAEECVDADDEPLTTDQRGFPRPYVDECDVGAFEIIPTGPGSGGK